MNATLLVLGGSAAGQTMDVGDRMTIGSAPGCTLQLADARVEALHATIERQGERYRLRSEVGVWIDATPMLDADLASFTKIDLGEATVLFKASGGYVSKTTLRAQAPRPPAPPRRTIVQLGRLARPRSSAAVAMVDRDRVLIAGGYIAMRGPVLAVAELFSLSACESVEVALTAERDAPIAAPCAAGVLVAGGGTESAELFDVRAGESRAVAPMHVARKLATAHALPDGRVLVMGGDRQDSMSGEIYDAERDRWSSLAGPQLRSVELAELGSGRLFVRALSGGGQPRPLPRYYVLDTATWRFTPVPPPRESRDHTRIVATGDGRALVMAGVANGYRRDVERFDPTTRRFEPLAELLAIRSGFAAAPLGGGRVLVAGGDSEDTGVYSAEIYDLGANRWHGVALPEGCGPLGVVARGDGSVVLVGAQAVFLAA